MANFVSFLPTVCTLLLLCFSSDDILTANFKYACGIVDCSSTKEGGPCFLPPTMVNHASVAMNLYYQSQGRHTWNCDFNGTGVVAVTDPSSGACKYPFKQTV
ncbi:major pollen allergen Ole e 10 [Heracleum sosnowskyi]|uniref:Major pollen allergen Ole e 10 n=1 Tax=Heracleum sosnowskyi TaxID=360622 RepID=A0AAD8MCV4_9APIA|nr:major pollen allergen Ole e 10 [Heracleum sosnowskyi]